jgi:hypothetical protein
MGEKYMDEKAGGEKSIGENRGRWDAGVRFPLIRLFPLPLSYWL